ncbi:hypothetical protein GWG65_24910 [Bradyrhizobium sp. CSA207]|uniref:hypothetical protein n=1 Tax=Bradyrhizobium sp. CSA207 TaxID=2698826 RepID=UPI0023B107A8|nr:hypothetical protein [Bradyrhizobium sp. CSA207]MDE5444630.1 hypothetical protein [Bradyrhizobium sp. CSA207]
MRASTAYFVGAGSIVAAIAIGLGGGIVAGNIMHPVAPKQGPDAGKMERRAEPATAVTTTSSAPSERVQYLTGSQTFGAMIAAPGQAQGEAKPEAKPETQSAQAKTELKTEPKAELKTEPASTPPQTAAAEPSKPAPASSPQAAKSAEQQASTQPASSPDNANAKARDSDVKRAASERRRAERRERWVERRHYDYRDSRGMRASPDWDDIARNVREDSDTRDVASRPRGGFPQIRLFGPDDD